MKRWEYLKKSDDSELEQLGRAGWELVGVLAGEPPTFYFKRQALDFRERVTLDQKHHYYTLLGVQAGEGERR